jgi:hypothetical protein
MVAPDSSLLSAVLILMAGRINGRSIECHGDGHTWKGAFQKLNRFVLDIVHVHHGDASHQFSYKLLDQHAFSPCFFIALRFPSSENGAAVAVYQSVLVRLG